jgi:hypothetical protein
MDRKQKQLLKWGVLLGNFLLVPLLLCLIFLVLPLGTIGPVVFFKMLFDLVMNPFLVWWIVAPEEPSEASTVSLFLKGVVSVVGGTAFTAFGVNLSIGLTMVMGLMDYDLM